MIPGQAPLMLEMAHRARYAFAKELCRGKTVLDLGCGAGYGSQMLAQPAASVRGIDISPEAVEFARSSYKAANLSYSTGGIDSLVAGEERFEAVVCFEVIEHLEQPGDLLKKMASVMTGDGLLVISTPNGKDDQNPYHQHGWDAKGFSDMLSGEFRDVRLYGQGSSPRVEKFREAESQTLQQADKRATEFKGRNPLVRLLPRPARHLLYTLMVGKSMPKEQQWTTDDFPIIDGKQDGEIIIAVCRKK
jgi:2-polyprenyl-3-methyl-5-hydroxy-6-metoxy-1,4-benzoquinol methylase